MPASQGQAAPADIVAGRFARFVRFALVGAAGFVVDAGVLYAGVGLGLGLYLGRACSYLCAATFTWALNRRFTFAASGPPGLAEWLRFVLANANGGIVNYLTYAGLVSWGPGWIGHPVLAVAAGSLAGLGVNFAASERFVFRREPPGGTGGT